MLSKKYKSALISITNPIPGLYSLEFRSLGGKFRYLPGQFLHLALDPDYDGSGQWPDSRCFSMRSNPDQETIKITYSVKGKFTSQMERQLKIGSEVWLKLPYGDLFLQPHNKVNTVFIAGGTGITPFLSLFTHSSFREYSNPKIYLGFKSESYNLYGNELMLIKDSYVKVFLEDINGSLDIEWIFLENGLDCEYFISGPPLMISSFKNALVSNGLPAKQIITDDWG
jgi:ferredoxin-NADP reductase